MKMNDLGTLWPRRDEMERAFARKDAGYDGVFCVAVKTMGIAVLIYTSTGCFRWVPRWKTSCSLAKPRAAPGG
jgi:hypothetical protein